MANPPDEVLTKAQAFFSRDWPHGGRFSRTEVSVDLAVFEPTTEERYGCAGLLFTTAIWAVSLGFRGKDEPVIHTARVVATAELNGTRLTLASSREDWITDLEAWAARELQIHPKAHN